MSDMMNGLQNLHTHTCYCDGKDTPEEMVLAAIEKGFFSIGFSGHAYMGYSKFFQKHGDHTVAYKEDVRRLQEKYRDHLKIYCGLEIDIFSDTDQSGYDYLIGAVHYLECEDGYVTFDNSAEELKAFVNRYFVSGMEFAKTYYRTLAELPQHGKFDILAHFDLITKHEGTLQLFDTSSKEYRYAAVEAAEALAGQIPLFEVNTGAISRGYRIKPYPSAEIIKELKRLGFGAVITSDCHDRRYLDCGFNEAAELLKQCGYKEKYILTEQGFVAVPL